MISLFEIPQVFIPGSPATCRARGLDFSALGGKRQRHSSALIGAGVTVDVRAKSRHGGI